MKKLGIFLIFSFLIIFSLQQIVFAETEEKEERTKKIAEAAENYKRKSMEKEVEEKEEIKEENRFDTGIYTKEFKLIDSLIKEYSKGYVNFKISDFKIGSTPKKRIISENIPLKYKWITPDHVDDLGYLNKFYNIQCEKPNITKNSLLIINRTSKGGLGEFVGISFFYDGTR